MQTAINSAARWLIAIAQKDKKLNPIPYPFFKKALEKQIQWAAQNRNHFLDFQALADAVKEKLHDAGIEVRGQWKNQPASFQLDVKEKQDEAFFDFDSQAKKTEIQPLVFSLDDEISAVKLSQWLQSVFSKTDGRKHNSLRFYAELA